MSIALGSIAELETQLLISKRLHFTEDIEEVIERLTKVRKLALGIMRYIENRLTPNA